MSQHRRIARVITRLNIGGPAIQAIDLSRELAHRGFETRLVHGSLSDGEGAMMSLRPEVDLSTTFVEALVRPVSPLNDLRALWRLVRIFRAWRPDIVHTHTAKAGTVGRAAAIFYNATSGRKRPARLVHTYHGHVFEGYFGPIATRCFLAIERWLGRRSDALIAISSQVKNDLVGRYAIGSDETVKLVRLGFDLDRLVRLSETDRSAARARLGLPADCIVVATVGRLTAIKQHSTFLRMASRLIRGPRRYHFLIVGDGELRSDLEAEAAALGLESQVRFLGWRGDLEQVYAATDIFVLTSRNEGTPVALIEAMAAAVCTVSTDVGGVRDVITDERVGVLVPFGDADRLASAVGELAMVPDRRREIGLAARESVKARFDRTRLVAEIEALYRGLLRMGANAHEAPDLTQSATATE